MTRPRGFTLDWEPQPHTKAVLGSVQTILADNAEILPLTLRQVFYMLVSDYGYEKTEKAYKRLIEAMNRARRAQVINMDHIRDDGPTRLEPNDAWTNDDRFVATVQAAGARFRLRRQEGQEQHIIVWCEAGGMAPQLADACDEYGVTVLSSGGFDSVTTKHNFAREIAYDHEAVEILHIGDHDPSGVHMHSSLDEDLDAFVSYYGGDITVTRLAVTPRQIRDMNLPTAPPKRTDRRSFSGLTTQAEAIPPRVLRRIVQEAIEHRIDRDILDQVLEREAVQRESLVNRLAQL